MFGFEVAIMNSCFFGTCRMRAQWVVIALDIEIDRRDRTHWIGGGTAWTSAETGRFSRFQMEAPASEYCAGSGVLLSRTQSPAHGKGSIALGNSQLSGRQLLA